MTDDDTDAETGGERSDDETESPDDGERSVDRRDGANGREGPLGDIADEVDRRRDSGDGPTLPADELFDEPDVDGVDREALWRQVAGETAPEDVVDTDSGTVGSTTDADADTGPTIRRTETGGRSTAGGDPSGDGEERVVAKAKYCRSCEHFSAPPDVRCTHDGTVIEEEVDMDHFRVVDCPIVREDEELEDV